MLTQLWGTRHITMPKVFHNWSIQSSDIAIFRFFKWPPPSSWIFEMTKFYWLWGFRGSRRISIPNFVKIGQLVAKILKFFYISRLRPPPTLHCRNSKNFIGWRCLEGPDASLYQISSKSDIPLWRYCYFFLSNFQNGRRRHLRLFKSQNFIGYWGPEGWDASACQISSKSVNRLRRFFDFSRCLFTSPKLGFLGNLIP